MITLLVIGLSLPSMAQLSIGVKAGANLASQSNPELYDADLKSRITFHVGGFVDYRFSQRFAVEGDLLYSMQGGIEDFAEFSIDDILMSDVSQKTTSHYINIPVTAKFYPAGNFYVEAGPQLGILLNSTWSAEGTSFEQVKEDIKNTQIADYAVVFGLGYRFNKLGIGARYVMGLNGTLKNMDGFKNRCAQASLSYAF